MKRIFLTVILIVCLFFGAYGQNTSPVDLVLLLDTSAYMSPSFEIVNDYLTGAFLFEFLRMGDTFHLIASSDSPRLDVSRRIAGIGDIETIIGRILLQYPVEPGINIGASLAFVEQYISQLPDRSKKIVLVAVGDEETYALVSSARQRLSARDITIDFIQVIPGQPLTNLPGSGRVPLVAAAPPPAGPAVTDGQVTAERPAEQIVERPPEQNVERPAETPIQNQQLPQRGTNEAFTSSLPFIIGLIILILLLLGLIIFFASRRLGSNPNRVMAEAASTPEKPKEKFEDHSKDLEKFAATQGKRSTPYDDRQAKGDKKKLEINPAAPILLNLFVEDQNTAIGKRNIHSLKSGYSLSVGGGNSDDFLIFLVDIPAHIGDIRRNGSQLTFVPSKPKYFPDTGSNEIRDCLNKTIRIISDKKYEIRFRLEMYEDPLVVLNRLLMSVKVPG